MAVDTTRRLKQLESRVSGDADTRHTKGRTIDRWAFVAFLAVQALYLVIAFYSVYMVTMNWEDITDINADAVTVTAKPAGRAVGRRADTPDLESMLPPIDAQV